MAEIRDSDIQRAIHIAQALHEAVVAFLSE